MSVETRRIFKSANTSQNIILELLQLMFLGELLAPSSERLCVVCPNISNLVIFDNRTGGFGAVNPEWGSREIRFIEIAINLMLRGTPVGIVVEENGFNEKFIGQISDATVEAGIDDGLYTMLQRSNLHAKGILTSRGLVRGTLNLTHDGIDIVDNEITYETSLDTITSARTNFESYFEEDK